MGVRLGDPRHPHFFVGLDPVDSAVAVQGEVGRREGRAQPGGAAKKEEEGRQDEGKSTAQERAPASSRQ